MSDALKAQLQEILDAEGVLTPAVVVDKARDESHPLHSRFEWDDSVAGEKYRRQQAGDLIRSVEWEYAQEPDGTPKKVRAFHSVNRVDGPSYVPIQDIQLDPFMAKLVIEAAKREWQALRRKHGHLAEFLAAVREDVAS
jgi:hypothetical protein